jgi:uncharacterized protein
MARQSENEAEGRRTLPICPLCRGEEFSKQEGRLDSKWGVTSHRMILLICANCKFILHFYEGNSIWDFD